MSEADPEFFPRGILAQLAKHILYKGLIVYTTRFFPVGGGGGGGRGFPKETFTFHRVSRPLLPSPLPSLDQPMHVMYLIVD